MIGLFPYRACTWREWIFQGVAPTRAAFLTLEAVRSKAEEWPQVQMVVRRGFASRCSESEILLALLQLRVLRLRLFQDGDVGVGTLPQCEEVLVFDFPL